MGRDSNPRYAQAYSSFQDCRPVDWYFLRHLTCFGTSPETTKRMFVTRLGRPHPPARNATSLPAAVFTTDVGNGNSQSPFGGTHRIHSFLSILDAWVGAT